MKNCSDGDPCTNDSCDPLTGVCLHEEISDCIPCVSDESCQGGTNQCIIGTCTSNWTCYKEVLHQVECDDGLFCTLFDTCDVGQCLGGQRSCNDFNPATNDWCDEENDVCVNEPV
jgi:hypothetical protein